MILDDQHREVLDRAIRNVLGTDLALQTYSQIVDGLPLAPVAHDQYLARRTVKHPIAHHTSLCAGAVEIAQGILSETDIDAFGFDAKVGWFAISVAFNSVSGVTLTMPSFLRPHRRGYS